MNIITKHGIVDLPAFFPDGTRAVVRSLDAVDVKNTGISGIVMNTYHLISNPGSSTIKQIGGIHKFCSWNGPVLTDSGGFQVFSLLRENPNSGSIRSNDIIFKPTKDKKIVLSPEKAVELQISWDSDIIMCLDYCTHPDDSYEINKKSVEITNKWAEKSKIKYNELVLQNYKEKQKPLIYAIIQGGNYKDLRRQCSDFIQNIGFDGYGFGGWPFNANNELIHDILAYSAELMPKNKPKYAMGIGKPENIVACAKIGYNLFDCAIPTRDARHLRLYVFNESNSDSINIFDKKFYSLLYIQDKIYKKDSKPISETCDCYSCKNYSRAYIHHLFRIEDALALRLATIHNLRFYSQLMDLIKKGIAHD